MNFKKRVNGSWADTPHYIHKTDTDTITTLPAVIYANGTTATVGLKGNMEQSSQPSPTNPIQPSECGERTGNLFSSTWEQGLINPTTGEFHPSNSSIYTVEYIPVKPNVIYSMSRDKYTNYITVRFYDTNKQYIGSGTVETIEIVSGGTVANPMRANHNFCCFKIIASGAAYMRLNEMTNDLSTKYMFVEGEYTASTMPVYEPYGYKIPISSANTTTPVYLGEVPTTRKINKLVLTGEEHWTLQSINSYGIANLWTQLPEKFRNQDVGLSTHLTLQVTLIAVTKTECFYLASSDVLYIRINATRASTVADFKDYLRQQYAAGTPVCVWYVLATPTTGIVNEPLRKIGDYADEVSGISIPTIAGANTLSVDTTLQPSEVTATYKGWHPVTDVHERDNGAWTE